MADNPRTIRTVFYAWIGVVVIGVALLATGCAPAPTTQGTETGLTVTGRGEATGEPDVAFVEIGIDVQDEDLGAAVNEANRVIADITAALSELGIAEEDIQTQSFNVFQDQRFDTNGPTGEIFYNVSNILSIRIVDIESTGDVLEISLENGANQIYGLNFGIDDPQGLQDEARTAAIEDAQRKAEGMAADLGVELGDPIFVSEGGSFSPVPGPRFATGVAEAADFSEVPVSTGQLNVSSSVTVTFEIR